jgi:protocatechuate 3,4-dioxygenase beta subunit
MSFPLRIILTLVLVASASTNSFTQTPVKEGTASVSGRVTIGGKAAPGITVVASLSTSFFDNKTVAKATTDEDGNYKLSGLSPGKLTVFPLAKAYVASAQSTFKEAGQSVNIAEGEAITKIDFSLVRGGVITGRITDAEGHPLIGERVSVLIKGSKPDRGPQMPMLGSGRNQTDDRGIYRVYGLAPGSYTVSVGQAASGSAVSIMGLGGSQYLKTYYPNVQDETKATAIEIKEGSEIKEIDISVGKPDAGHAVSGRVVDESGQPVPNVYIAHSVVTDSGQQIGGGMNFSGNQSDAAGRFKLAGLRPGRYAVFTMAAGVNSSNAYSEPTIFEMADADVTGIEIKMRRGGTINGVAVIDNGDPSATALLQTVTLYAFVEQKGVSAPSYGTSPIAADSSFHISGLAPGKVRMGIQGFPAPPKGLSLVRTELDGVDQPEGVELTAGAELKGVRLVFAYGTGSIRGNVTIENGPPPDGMTLQVTVRSASGDARRLRRGSDLDARLQFVIDNLPPGEYELVVRGVSSGTEGKPAPPVEFLKQTVSVSNGSETKVNVVADMKKGHP